MISTGLGNLATGALLSRSIENESKLRYEENEENEEEERESPPQFFFTTLTY